MKKMTTKQPLFSLPHNSPFFEKIKKQALSWKDSFVVVTKQSQYVKYSSNDVLKRNIHPEFGGL